MSITTQWLAGRRPLARISGKWMKDAGVAVELGSVQPIVSTIDDNGTRFVGVFVSRANVYVDLRIPDPEAFRVELGEAIVWQKGSADG